MSGPCCTHDALDWFAAIGPTLAAGAAAWATWKTAQAARQIGKDSLALQRHIQRPLIVVRSRRKALRGGVGIHLVAELMNTGQTAANIETFRIIIDNNEAATRPMEEPREFWSRVFNTVVPSVKLVAVVGHVVLAQFALPAGENQPLVEVRLEGDALEIHKALRKLVVDVEYKAPWGERYSQRVSLGGPEARH